MVQIFDIVKELSEDPIFLSLSRDLMYSTATKKVVLMRYLIEIHPTWLPKLKKNFKALSIITNITNRQQLIR